MKVRLKRLSLPRTDTNVNKYIGDNTPSNCSPPDSYEYSNHENGEAILSGRPST